MTIKKAELKQVLAILKKIADRNATIAIRSNALITSDALTVDNLNERVSYSIETGISNPITVGVSDLDALTPIDAKDTGAWDLSVEVGGDELNTMVAVSGDETLKLDASLSAEDFPPTRPLEQVSTHMLNVAEFLEGLEYLLPAISTDESRPHLQGVCFKNDVMVATHGHAFHWVPSGLILAEGEQMVTRSAIITIIAILKQVPAKKRAATACSLTTVHEGNCQFTCGNWRVDIRIDDDTKFPPFEHLISTSSEYTTTVTHRTFETALKRIKKMTSSLTLGVRLTVEQEKLTLETSVGDCRKSCKLSIPATSTVEAAAETTIGFNADYLLAGIKWKGSEAVAINTSGELDPIVVHLVTNYPFAKVGAMIMPMRLDD